MVIAAVVVVGSLYEFVLLFLLTFNAALLLVLLAAVPVDVARDIRVGVTDENGVCCLNISVASGGC